MDEIQYRMMQAQCSLQRLAIGPGSDRGGGAECGLDGLLIFEISKLLYRFLSAQYPPLKSKKKNEGRSGQFKSLQPHPES